MEKKDLKVKINNTELEGLDPQTKQLIIDLRRHFSGIIHAVARWNLAAQVKKKST